MSYNHRVFLRAISDTSGNIIKEITYDTYGNILSDTNANLKVPFGFAGGLLDKDTGLTRFGYRDYVRSVSKQQLLVVCSFGTVSDVLKAPLKATGKWTAKDPIDFNGGDTNLYGYVLGDPVNFVDVDGLNPAAAVANPAVLLLVGGIVLYWYFDTYPVNLPYWELPSFDPPSSPVCEAKGGKQNKNNEYQDYSNEELDKMYKDPNTPKSEKQKIKTQQKANRTRNTGRRNSRGY